MSDYIGDIKPAMIIDRESLGVEWGTYKATSQK